MKESEIQKKIVNMLRNHPLVAWCYVTSAGYVKGLNGGTMFKIGVVGMADIMGQLKTGQLLAVEVKVPGKTPSKEQLEFIDTVNKNNGVAFWVDNVEEAKELMKGLEER